MVVVVPSLYNSDVRCPFFCSPSLTLGVLSSEILFVFYVLSPSDSSSSYTDMQAAICI